MVDLVDLKIYAYKPTNSKQFNQLSCVISFDYVN